MAKRLAQRLCLFRDDAQSGKYGRVLKLTNERVTGVIKVPSTPHNFCIVLQYYPVLTVKPTMQLFDEINVNDARAVHANELPGIEHGQDAPLSKQVLVRLQYGGWHKGPRTLPRQPGQRWPEAVCSDNFTLTGIR